MENPIIELLKAQTNHSFWVELSKGYVVAAIETSFSEEVTNEYGVSDFSVVDDKVIVNFYKRILPVSKEELRKIAGLKS